MKRLLLAAALCCLGFGFAFPVSAHETGYEADSNRNGYIEVYRTSDFGGDFKAVRSKVNRQLVGTNEPRVRMVDSYNKAEVWLHLSGKEGCRSFTLWQSVDNVGIGNCTPGKRRQQNISHELGHVYGFPAGDGHHECPEWEPRTVNVSSCGSDFVGFGPHDLNVLSR